MIKIITTLAAALFAISGFGKETTMKLIKENFKETRIDACEKVTGLSIEVEVGKSNIISSEDNDKLLIEETASTPSSNVNTGIKNFDPPIRHQKILTEKHKLFFTNRFDF